MSTNLNYKQVANVTRRTWDTETYEKKAKARLESAAAPSADGHLNKKKSESSTGQPDSSLAPSSLEETEKEEFLPAERGAVGPEGSERAFLKARKAKVDLESKVGTSEIISAEAAATTRLFDSKDDGADQAINDRSVVKTGVGWHCRVCDCFLKDSHTYLDHINGRKHQRALGYSMRVERSSKEQLLSKLSDLSKKKEQEEEERRRKGGSDSGILDYNDLVKAKDEEAQRRKEERQRKRLERKKKQGEAQNEVVSEPQDEMPQEEGGGEKNQLDDDVEEEVDPSLAAMMGFTGFGGGTKKR
jgi:U4/U6.U5 tri-snRNP component SNU23